MKQIFMLIIISIFAHQQLFTKTQDNYIIDSILIELPKIKEDTNLIKSLNTLSQLYLDINIVKSHKYGKKALVNARKSKYEIGEANALKCIGTIQKRQSNYDEALINYKDALHIYKSMGFEKEITIMLNIIGVIYKNKTQYEKALNYYKEALVIAKKINDKKRIATTLHSIAIVFSRQSDFYTSLKYYYQALKIFEEIGYQIGSAATITNIGAIYFQQSKYKKALNFSLKSLEYYEKLEQKREIAISLYNISGIYSVLSNHSKAYEYSKNALKINKKIGNKKGMAYSYLSLGVISFELSNYEISLEYINKSLAISKGIGNKLGVAMSYENIGDLYKKLSKDSIFYKKLPKKETIKYQQAKNIESAIKYYLIAINKFGEINDYNKLQRCQKNISVMYRFKKDYKNSLKYYKKHISIKDSIFSEQSQIKIADLEAKRENELKDLEIKLLNEKNIMKAKQTNIIIISFSLGFILFVFLNIILYKRYRFKTKVILLLKEKNNEIRLITKQIEKQHYDLQLKTDEVNIAKKIVDELNATLQDKIDAQIIELEETNQKLKIVDTSQSALLDEIDSNKKELLNHTVVLAEKNTFLDELKKQLLKIQTNSHHPFNTIQDSIDKEIHSKEYWKNFENQFKELDYVFSKKLTDTFTDLTYAEIRICQLIKLNLKNKDISSILRLSLRTVETHRTNIRKKIGIKRGANLTNALLNI